MPFQSDSGACEVDTRMAELEARVAMLERQLPTSTRPAPTLARAAPAATTAGPKGAQWEARIGLRWLNRAGALAVLVALVLGARWANEHGYLSAPIRTAIATFLAAFSLWSGLRMSSAAGASTRVFSVAFQVIGAVGLYVICFTSRHLDMLLGPGLATGLACMLTLLLLCVAVRLSLPSMASLAALGSLCLPLLGALEEPAFSPLFVYLCAQAVVFTTSARRWRWPQVAPLQAVGLTLYFVFLSSELALDAPQSLAMVCGLGSFVGLYVRDELAGEGASPNTALAAWFSLVGALGCWALGNAWLGLAPACGIGALLWLGLLMWREPGKARCLQPALMASLPLLAGSFGTAGGMPWVLVAAPLALLLLSLLREDDNQWLAVRGLSLALLPMLAAALVPKLPAGTAQFGLLFGIVALLWPLWRPRPGTRAFALHAPALVIAHILGLWAMVLVLEGNAAMHWGTAALLPALYGVVLVFWGWWCHDPWTRYAGLAMAAWCALKLTLVDVWALSAGGRVGVFLGLGGLLLAASYLYTRVEQEPGAATET